MFKIHHYKKLNSTNDKAKEFDENNVIIAETQTKGKGRFNRNWSSGKGGIYMSIVLKPVDNLAHYTFIAALSVQKAIKKICNFNARIKWPNDIMADNKKLCGILTENFFKGEISKMIIGIGLNVNNKITSQLKNKTMTLKDIFKRNIDKEKLIKSILVEFKSLYKKYNKKGFKPILTEWKNLSDTLNRNIKVKTLNKTFYGKAIDVDKDCNLILKNSKIKKIIEGDIFYL